MNPSDHPLKLIQQAKERIDLLSQEGLDRYLKLGDSKVLRALIQAVPAVGGSLDTLIFNKAEVIRRQRIVEYIDALYKFVQLLDEQKIDREFFGSEAGLSVFEQALKSAMLEAVKRKREVLAAFTVGSSTKGLSNRTDHLFLLQVIAIMSIEQLLVLFDLAENQAKLMEERGVKRKFWRIWPAGYLRGFHYTDVEEIACKRIRVHNLRSDFEEIIDGLMFCNVIAFPELYNDEGGSRLRYDHLTVTHLGGMIYEYLSIFHDEFSIS